MRPSTAASASVFCAGLLAWSSLGFAQDLGRGRGGLVESGAVDVDQLAQRSDLIVRGFIVGKEPKWVGRVIYTHYDLEVQETLKGAARNGVVVAVAGGALGNVQLTVPNAPDLRVGDQLVFFGVPLEGEASFAPVGTFDGIVRIRPGGGNFEATVAPRGKPEELEAFLQEVRTLSGRP